MSHLGTQVMFIILTVTVGRYHGRNPAKWAAVNCLMQRISGIRQSIKKERTGWCNMSILITVRVRFGVRVRV
jgi:hypothetical protein